MVDQLKKNLGPQKEASLIGHISLTILVSCAVKTFSSPLLCLFLLSGINLQNVDSFPVVALSTCHLCALTALPAARSCTPLLGNTQAPGRRSSARCSGGMQPASRRITRVLMSNHNLFEPVFSPIK